MHPPVSVQSLPIGGLLFLALPVTKRGPGWGRPQAFRHASRMTHLGKPRVGALSEFDLIRDYFSQIGSRRPDVTLGVGDDCALLRVPQSFELAVSIDTLVAGVHFFADCDPEGLGHKSLAVGPSDLAAVGAEPTWATLALTIPEADENWLRAFGCGFGHLAREHGKQVAVCRFFFPLKITESRGRLPGRAPCRRPGEIPRRSGRLAGVPIRRILRPKSRCTREGAESVPEGRAGR